MALVHKKGARSDPKNERPVSLTPVSCKILERIICKEIMANAERQGLFSSMQFAFRKGKSTEDCLLVSTSSAANAPNEGDCVDVVHMDFENAAETMPRDLVLSLLPRKGDGVKILTRIPEFLRERNFRVMIRESLSRTAYASTGCPQGTLLGGVFFLLFMHQIMSIVDAPVHFYIYADDEFMVIVRIEDDHRLLQRTSSRDLQAWACSCRRTSVFSCIWAKKTAGSATLSEARSLKTGK